MAEKIALIGAETNESYAEVQASGMDALIATIKAVRKIADQHENGEQLVVQVISDHTTQGVHHG